MSKYPWYVTFKLDSEYEDGNVLEVNTVNYTEPDQETISFRIDEEEKKNYFAAFPTYPDYKYIDFMYQVHWFREFNGTITQEPNIDLDFTKHDMGFPLNDYLDLTYTYMLNVVMRMLQMQKEIGEIWKMPDMLDCCLYAQTEATEYLESVLLQVRSKDSRNNKKLEDFDSATEMFDVTMMLLRSLIAHEMDRDVPVVETEEEKHLRIVNTIRVHFLEYKERRLSGDNFYQSELEKLYTEEPNSLSKMVNKIIDWVREYEHYRSYPDELAAYQEVPFELLVSHIFIVLEYVAFHPIVQNLGYDHVAKAKLDKIYQKNLAKKEAMEKVSE